MLTGPPLYFGSVLKKNHLGEWNCRLKDEFIQIFLRASATLRVSSLVKGFFSCCQQVPWQEQNWQCVDPTNKYCVHIQRQIYHIPLWHRDPLFSTHQFTVTLSDTPLHEHEHCRLSVSPTYSTPSYQIIINLRQKIAPNKYTIYSSLSKLQCLACLGNYLICFLKLKIYVCDLFLYLQLVLLLE